MESPFLDKLDSKSWEAFVTSVDAYRARGGEKSVRSMMSAGALSVVLLRLRMRRDAAEDDEDGEEAFVRAVSSFFAPATVLEALDRFKALSMRSQSGPSLDATILFVQAFERLEGVCAEVLPPQRQLIKVFLKGLRPARLTERVECRDPETLDEAKVAAIEEVEAMVSVMREAGCIAGAVDPRHSTAVQVRAAAVPAPRPPLERSPRPSAGRDAGGDAHQARSGDARRPVTCFACGLEGHLQRECPGRQRGWQREQGGRLMRPDPPLRTPMRESGARPQGPEAPRPQPKREQGARGKAAREGSAGSDGLRRVRVTLQTQGGCVEVNALLDTGSNNNFISPAVYDALLEIGAFVTRTQRRIETLSGVVQAAHVVTCMLRVPGSPSGEAARAVEVQVELLVVDYVSEDAVIGLPTMTVTGLSARLVHEVEPAVSEPEAPPELDILDDEEVPSDGTLPQIEEVSCAEQLRALVLEYADVFGPLPKEGAAVEPMTIVLKPGFEPKPMAPRRLSPALQLAVAESVTAWFEDDIIQSSSSPYSSPIVVVRKKDGTYRPCVDYRQLNSGTVDLKFPLQQTRAVLERMAGNTIFATLDLRSGFHQIPIAEESRALTAFPTHDGLYEFKRIQFGLKNGPSYFQQTMSRVLNGIVGAGCEVFIDDIVVYGRNNAEFVCNLRRVFERLRQYRLRVKGSKCRIGQAQVEYLGHLVDGTGVSLTAIRKQGVQDIRAPKTTAQLKSFLGLVSYFRTFVRDYANIASPLHALCSPKRPFRWDEEHHQAFERLKAAVVEAPVLHHINYDHPVVLRTDASTVGIGGVLLQVVDGVEYPVSFVSKAFSPVEVKWSTLEQEAYAVFYCIKSLQHHLRGHKFTVETDHRNLMYLQKATAPKVVRWRLFLQEYDYDVRHIAGKDNVVADGLSRCLAAIELPHGSHIKAVHNAVLGHRGIALTMSALVEAGIEWPEMRKDVELFIKSCAVCQKTRLSQGSVAAALATTIVHEPFEVVAMDTIGPLPADAYGNCYIVAAIDCFSRFVELKATKGATASEAAGLLLDVFGRYGAPRSLRTDQGSQFTARVIQNFLRLVGTKQQLTVPHRPESNGLIERTNQEIGRHLRAIVMDCRLAETWSSTLPLVQRMVNATPNRTTGTTPARIMFGGAVNLDRQLLKLEENEESDSETDSDSETQSYEDYIQSLIDSQRVIVDAARQHQEVVVQKVLAKSPEQVSEFEDG